MAQVTTKRDRPILVHDGFMYRFAKRSADGGKLWRCSVTACLGLSVVVFLCSYYFYFILPDSGACFLNKRAH